MAIAIRPRMTEPDPVPCNFAEGCSIELHDTYVRLVFWVDLEVSPEVGAPERRIVARIAMPTLTARVLVRDLRKATTRGAN